MCSQRSMVNYGSWLKERRKKDEHAFGFICVRASGFDVRPTPDIGNCSIVSRRRSWKVMEGRGRSWKESGITKQNGI